jgi:hypothetical protein
MSILEELQQWCDERGVTLEAGATNAKGMVVPADFFFPVGVMSTIQIMVKDATLPVHPNGITSQHQNTIDGING